jgi:LmbE family N-acetylglucosaminyl deacetylase
MPKALFLSPHLDDVAFSCGGAARRLADAGWDAVLCTVFTRSVPQPEGFALACQLDKGLGPEVDYMALRRAEDAEAAGHLRTSEVLWLDLPEAPHRGYESAPALFGPFSPHDGVEAELEAALAPLLVSHDLVLAPQGIGEHVDHRRVRDVVLKLAPGARTAWYRDTPYAIRHPAARPTPEVARSGPEAAVPLGEGALEAKLAACAAYASQLGFQFGGVGAMRAALAGFARAEAVRLGAEGPFAEAVIAPTGAASLLRG